VFARRLPAPHTGNLAPLSLYRCRREYLLIPPIASVASTVEADSNIIGSRDHAERTRVVESFRSISGDPDRCAPQVGRQQNTLATLAC
jgi:hypothetical protein